MLSRFRQSSLFPRVLRLALLALLLPTMVALVHRPAAAADDLYGRSHVCGAPDNTGKTSGGKQTFCPICQALAHISHGSVPPPAVKLGAASAIVVAVQSAPVENLRAVFRAAQVWPRAPPLFI